MIGDSLHDKEVADELGVKCILCSQGSHAHHRLAAVAPAAETLIEAVKKVLVI
jgi:phosphoglycolate phosphatase-like HAD superfamily hydrolase